MSFGFGFGFPKNYVAATLAPFTPARLFTTGVNGAWYDPSDVNLTWRRNLLTYSEQFDNAAWTKINAGVSITANASIAPDGTVTADKLVGTNATSTKEVYNSTAVPTAVGSTYTASVYAKAAEYNWIYVVCNVNATLSGTYFNLATGEIGNTVGSGSTPTITFSGDGWYRVASTRNATTSVGYIEIFPAQNNGTGAPGYTGDNTSGIYIWGAQLELGSTATPYQRITDGIQDYLQYQAQPVLYRDAAGTQPVTAFEQPVGLMLDKSKGLVLGSELVTNGDFSNGTTGWSAGGGALLSVVSGKLRITQPSSTGVWAYQALTTVVGRRYWVSLNFESISGSKFAVFVSTTIGGTETYLATPESVASYKFSFVATATTHYINVQPWTPAVGREAYFDNISVRELPGNHAFNSSGNSANFPVLSARYNLLTKTEQFDDAAWSKTASTAPSVSVTNPIGGALANKLTEDTTNATHSVGQYISASAGSCKITVYAKQAGRQRLVFVLQDSSKNNGCYAVINLNTVNVDVDATLFGAGFNNGSASATSVGNGWVLCTLTATVPATTIGLSCQLDNATSGPLSQGYLGNGTDGIYIWGADLRVANDSVNLPAYQRVNTATDYDTVGFKPYLRFNGTNQWLQTNSIDFTYGDKMFVSAGVRKLSDAASGVIIESSTNPTVNSGTFGLFAPNNIGAAGNFAFFSRGTSNGVADGAISLSPITKQLSGIGNISGDQTILRVNGAQAVSGTADQGTGNYGTYPLYIGARAGTSVWFNGRLHQLVVAGKQASASEITSTETYINQKTGAF